jgi:hypothetical protein
VDRGVEVWESPGGYHRPKRVDADDEGAGDSPKESLASLRGFFALDEDLQTQKDVWWREMNICFKSARLGSCFDLIAKVQNSPELLTNDDMRWRLEAIVKHCKTTGDVMDADLVAKMYRVTDPEWTVLVNSRVDQLDAETEKAMRSQR